MKPWYSDPYEWGIAERKDEYAEDKPLGTTVENAARDALENLGRWGEASLVKLDDGTYEGVPSAHVYHGSRYGHVVDAVTYREMSDITGDDRPWEKLDAQEQDWAVGQAIEGLTG